MVLSGEVAVDGRPVRSDRFAYLGLGRDELVLDAPEPARVLLLGGVPFGEPILMWWNFVARSREEITGAYEQWRAEDGRFGEVHSVAGPDPGAAAALGCRSRAQQSGAQPGRAGTHRPVGEHRHRDRTVGRQPGQIAGPAVAVALQRDRAAAGRDRATRATSTPPVVACRCAVHWPPQARPAAGDQLSSIPALRDRRSAVPACASGRGPPVAGLDAAVRAGGTGVVPASVCGAPRVGHRGRPERRRRRATGTGSAASAVAAGGVDADAASAAGCTSDGPALPLAGSATSSPAAITTTAAADQASTLPDSRRRSSGTGKPSASNGRARRVSSARRATPRAGGGDQLGPQPGRRGLHRGRTRRGSAAGAKPSSAPTSSGRSPRRPSSAASVAVGRAAAGRAGAGTRCGSARAARAASGPGR